MPVVNNNGLRAPSNWNGIHKKLKEKYRFQSREKRRIPLKSGFIILSFCQASGIIISKQYHYSRTCSFTIMTSSIRRPEATRNSRTLSKLPESEVSPSRIGKSFSKCLPNTSVLITPSRAFIHEIFPQMEKTKFVNFSTNYVF